MVGVLEQLDAVQSMASASADSAFRDVVQQLADGTSDPELSTVQRVLADAGKSVEQLREAVARRHSRTELQQQLRDVECGIDRMPDLQNKIAQLDAELERAVQQHAEKARPLRIELADLQMLPVKKTELERQLTATTGEPLASQMEAVKQRTAATDATLHDARHKLRDAKRNLEASRPQLDADAVAFREKKIGELTTQVNGLEGERDDLLAKHAELRERAIWS